MNEQLQQSAKDVLGNAVKGASGFTAGSGLATLADLIPDVLGCISIVVGIFVTVALYIKKNKLLNLEIEQKLSDKDTP